MKNSKLLIFAGIIFLFSSCAKENYKLDKFSKSFEWNPALAVPLVKTSLTLRHLVRDFDSTELFVEDISGKLYVAYNEKVFTYQGDIEIDIPAQNFFGLFTGQEVIDSGGVVPSITLTKKLISPFSISGSKIIDSVIFKKGKLTLNVTSGFLHTGSLLITFPSMKKNGVPFSKTININTSDGTFSFNDPNNELTGYTLDMANLGVDTNKVLIRYELTLFNSGSVVNPADQVLITTAFDSLDFSAIFGYMGTFNMDIPLDTVVIELFDKAFKGAAYLERPKIEVIIDNSYGIPIQLYFKDFYSYSFLSGSTSYIYGSGIPTSFNPLMINYPAISEVGAVKRTVIPIDRYNSNLPDVISTLPRYIMFSLNSKANPNGNTDYNFVLDTSKVEVELDVLLPMEGRANYFALQDTFDFNFDDIAKDIDILEEAMIRINTHNGMPMDVKMQVYFTDSLYNPMDSLFTTSDLQQIIKSGKLNSAGKVYESTHKITDIVFPKARIDNLTECKFILLKGEIQTTNYQQNENVVFYSHYTIDVKLGVIAKFHIDENDL